MSKQIKIRLDGKGSDKVREIAKACKKRGLAVSQNSIGALAFSKGISAVESELVRPVSVQ